MIISHKYKFIFIHIPKCAGTSITRTLVPILGKDDLVLGCTPEGEILHEENLKKGGITKHSTAQQILEQVGEETWNSYFKFCFVRNPWNLMVSQYYWSIKTLWNDENGTIEKIKHLDDFEDYLLSQLPTKTNCVDYVSDNDGNIIVDFIGKTELINWDLPRIYRRLGIPAYRHLARENTTEHELHVNLYNPLTRELIQDWYRKDIIKFNYSFREYIRKPVNNIKKDNFPRKEWLIIHGAHHKAATNWFHRIFRNISERFSWKLEIGSKTKLCPDEDTDLFLNFNSNFDFVSLGPYVGTHLIRDPRDMIISGYYYHLWCNETWCRQPVDDFNGKSYQEVLNGLSIEDGIMFEMSNTHGSFNRTASFMMNWNYNNPYILEIKFEDILNDIEHHFIKIFEHYGFNDKETEIAMKIVDQCNFEKMTGRVRGQENSKNHYRKGIVGDWKNHFTVSHKKAYKELYPGLLEKLGYEITDQW